MNRVTLALGVHRLECLPAAARLMADHAAVALEEPATPGFEAMLAGTMAVDEYLQAADPDFPRFAAALCRTCQELSGRPVAILQVEPYMEALVGVHERFAAGGKPDDIPARTLERVVYEVERRWSAALLEYYRKVAAGPFAAAVAAVVDFARVDAGRGRMRDDLRAQALVSLALEYPSLYVEAGHLHHPLLGELRRRLAGRAAVEVAWLQEEGARPLTGRRQILGPGDTLTLLLAHTPKARGPLPELLAARSLIHTRLQINDELAPTPENPWPHTADEAACAALVARLSLADCADLFPRLRRLDPAAAKAVTRTYLR